MANDQAMKKNQASLQVLKTLRVLLEDNYTMSEIVDRLNSQEKEPIFNNSVVSKYINTCRYCGIEISKIRNRYYVIKMPFGINFDIKELELIKILQDTATSHLSQKMNITFQNIFSKINKITNKHFLKVDKNERSETLETFDQAIEEKRKIHIITTKEDLKEVIPLGIVHNNKRVFFNILNGDGEKLISLEKIIAIEKLTDRFTPKNQDITVLFKLTGGLAKRYTPREHETVEITSDPSSIVVANKGEHKEILFARLLRYDSCCEIISPKSYREEMKQLLKEMLSNYEE